MAGISQSARSEVLALLRSLRSSIAQARDSLMHYRADRIDRDKLEPAARKVDDLMNRFAGDFRDPLQGSVWVAEILGGLDNVTNDKAAAALNEARANIAALLQVMNAAGGKVAAPATPVTGS